MLNERGSKAERIGQGRNKDKARKEDGNNFNSIRKKITLSMKYIFLVYLNQVLPFAFGPVITEIV